MTKKYEKFEEWMVGKAVKYSFVDPEDGTRTGVISSSRSLMSADEVWIDCDYDTRHRWVKLSRVEFLEEAPVKEEIEATIPWEVGQGVYCLIRGKGQVNDVGRDSVVVWFDKVGAWKYTDKGELLGYEGVRTLFFSEPTIIADTMPPKKPFAPKLKFDDKLLVINSYGKVEYYGYVEKEFEDSVAMRTGDVYEKVYYNFFKLGEEIKFEEN